MKRFLLLLAIVSFVSSCGEESSDTKMAEAQESIAAQANNEVGLPIIKHFAEKRTLKEILEMRDQEVATYTYYISEYDGKLHLLCQSIGFAISAATQYTNPQKIAGSAHYYAVIAQADPNGLFSPASTEGSYVRCLNKTTGKVGVMYTEPRVIVSQWPLN